MTHLWKLMNWSKGYKKNKNKNKNLIKKKKNEDPIERKVRKWKCEVPEECVDVGEFGWRVVVIALEEWTVKCEEERDQREQFPHGNKGKCVRKVLVIVMSEWRELDGGSGFFRYGSFGSLLVKVRTVRFRSILRQMISVKCLWFGLDRFYDKWFRWSLCGSI